MRRLIQSGATSPVGKRRNKVDGGGIGYPRPLACKPGAWTSLRKAPVQRASPLYPLRTANIQTASEVKDLGVDIKRYLLTYLK
jgi:hypothetical protein